MDDINIKMTLDELMALENKVQQNKDTVQDYQKIDSFLSKFLPKDYLINAIRENGVYTLEELENFRRNPPEPRNPSREGGISGKLLGLINFLKTRL